MKTLRIKALGELRNVHGCSRSVFVQQQITLVKLINFFLLSFCLLQRVEKKIITHFTSKVNNTSMNLCLIVVFFLHFKLGLTRNLYVRQ